jgi:chromatin segregation and condensation protein Rec8/ScpA/Scc1 (kleisin family)
MLPSEEGEGLAFEPGEAADELLARMLEYSRYKSAAAYLRERLESESGYRCRAAPFSSGAAAGLRGSGRARL